MYHTAVVSTTGKVVTWGRNSEGQLGINNFSPSYQATPQGPLTGALTSRFVNFVACGEEHTIVSTATEILGFGWNEHNQVCISQVCSFQNLTDPIAAWRSHCNNHC